MSRKFLWVFLTAGSFACHTKQPPYLKHKLVKWEKVSGSCEAYVAKFTMESTIIGERYGFQKCLAANYSGEYTAERKGDTVDVRFKSAEGPEFLYGVTLDIDAYPSYHFLTVDGTTFAVIPTQN